MEKKLKIFIRVHLCNYMHNIRIDNQEDALKGRSSNKKGQFIYMKFPETLFPLEKMTVIIYKYINTVNFYGKNSKLRYLPRVTRYRDSISF